MKYFGFVVAAVVAFFVGSWVFQPDSCGAACNFQITSLSPADFQSYLSASGGVLIDIRTPQEFAAGHLTGAVNNDYYQTADFSAYLDTLAKDKFYFIYCRTGNRSGLAKKIMQQKGFTHVADLAGGITAWQAAGLPLSQ